MFETKRKIDSKIRFQNASFKTQLQKARGYKRPPHKPAQQPWENLLRHIGLASRLKQILAGAVLVLLIYIVYFPNFLSVKDVQISGLRQADNELVKTEVLTYLKTKSVLPQNNLLTLSTTKLKGFLSKDGKIQQIGSIKKHYSNKLEIALIPRVEEYILQSSQGSFLVSGDGLITRELGLSTTGPASNLTAIKFQGSESLAAGQPFLNPNLQNFLSTIKTKLSEVAKAKISYIRLEDFNSQDVTVFLQSGYKIIFDVKLSVGESLNHLNLLLANIEPKDQSKMSYIDLRFKNKGFVCFKNTTCDKETPAPVATSTTDTLNDAHTR